MHDDLDDVNPSDNQTLRSIVATRVSRRSLLRGATVAAAGVAVAANGAEALLGSVPVSADGGRRHHGYGKGFGYPAGTPLLGFAGIEPSTADTVVVPPGYTASVLIAWGDPVSDGPVFNPDASNTAEEQAQQWGMHNDGIVYFAIGNSSSHGLIVQNHEYTDDGLLFADGMANWTPRRRPSRRTPTAWASSRCAGRGAEVGRSCGRRGTPAGSPRRRRCSSAVLRPAIRGCRPAPIRPDGRCWAPSTTARWGTRHGARISPARRTSTTTSTSRQAPHCRRHSSAMASRLLSARRGRSGSPPTPGSTCRRNRTSRTDSVGSSRSTRGTATAHRSSAPASGASSTRERGCRRPAMDGSSSTWVTTRSTSTSTDSCRTCRGEMRSVVASTRSMTGSSTWPASTRTAQAPGSP